MHPVGLGGFTVSQRSAAGSSVAVNQPRLDPGTINGPAPSSGRDPLMTCPNEGCMASVIHREIVALERRVNSRMPPRDAAEKEAIKQEVRQDLGTLADRFERAASSRGIELSDRAQSIIDNMRGFADGSIEIELPQYNARRTEVDRTAQFFDVFRSLVQDFLSPLRPF